MSFHAARRLLDDDEETPLSDERVQVTAPMSATPEGIENEWWCDHCQRTKSPVQVTYPENCTRCGNPVRWIEPAPVVSATPEGKTPKSIKQAIDAYAGRVMSMEKGNCDQRDVDDARSADDR